MPQRKVSPRNIVFRLRLRETGSSVTPFFKRRRVPGSAFNVAHSLQSSILPNATVCDVGKPAIVLRRFSLDGNYFLAFSFDFKSVLIYVFKGVSAANETLLSKLAGRNSSSTNGDHVFNEVINDVEIRAEIFERFFELKHVVMIPARANQHIFRNLCLFTRGRRHVVLASTSLLQDGDGNAPGDGILQPRYFGSDTSDIGERRF